MPRRPVATKGPYCARSVGCPMARSEREACGSTPAQPAETRHKRKKGRRRRRAIFFGFLFSTLRNLLSLTVELLLSILREPNKGNCGDGYLTMANCRMDF